MPLNFLNNLSRDKIIQSKHIIGKKKGYDLGRAVLRRGSQKAWS
jgi:hypothetical protein